jgi:hypothetical protein
MKDSNIYNIAEHTLKLVFSGTNFVIFLVSGLVFGGLLAFFYGLFVIPVPGGALGFYRMEPPTTFEYGYLIFSAVVSALIVTITIYAARLKVKGTVEGTGASALGLSTGILGAVCPACLGINFLAFGNVFTTQLAFLIPYILWIQIAGIGLLSIGLYLVAKSAYTKTCIACSVEGPDAATVVVATNAPPASSLMRFFPAILILVLLLMVYQISSIASGSLGSSDNSVSGNMLVTQDGEKISIDAVIEEVTPRAGFTTNVRWDGVVSRMIERGVLDPQLLEEILAKRYGQEMKPEWRAILAGEDATLSIDSENAVFMMYVLWAMAKHNENQILSDSPFAKYFTNYDIGVGLPGYNDTPLLALSPEQQAVATRVAENAYRPCCGNSTAAPDCSHGYSALGLVQLMASQGFSEQEIFETFVQFNSFWFPETYIKNALYFKITEGTDWADVDKELVAGEEYSTLSGSYTAKNFLKTNFGI